MKSRDRQRAHRKQKHQEELLDRHNVYGAKDLTAYNAMSHMKFGDKANLILQ